MILWELPRPKSNHWNKRIYKYLKTTKSCKAKFCISNRKVNNSKREVRPIRKMVVFNLESSIRRSSSKIVQTVMHTIQARAPMQTLQLKVAKRSFQNLVIKTFRDLMGRAPISTIAITSSKSAIKTPLITAWIQAMILQKVPNLKHPTNRWGRGHLMVIGASIVQMEVELALMIGFLNWKFKRKVA